jgi:S-adenosylmethionine hydrolase
MQTPSKIVTLTTDFGTRDPFVGVMKGRLLGRFPAVRIVDLTHEILPHWPAEAGFWLARSFGYFPHGTVHVAVVDPGVGTSRELLAVTAKGHLFLAPDNGLLAPIVGADRDAEIIRIDRSILSTLGLGRPSATFHGRDIFAPLAADLAAGRCLAGSLGERIEKIVPAWTDDPTVELGVVTGVVMTIDHFGNLITNIDAALLHDLRAPQVHAGNHVFDLHRTYGDVPPGQSLALINSFEVLELACAEGNAAEKTGLSRGAPVVVRDRVAAIPGVRG